MPLTEHQRRSRRQEKQTADDLGGRVTPGSGNTVLHGNDVFNKTLSVECKTTLAKGYRLTLDTLRGAEIKAAQDGREMVMQIEIQGHRYAVTTWDFFLELQER
jgi:hypothetical protein